MTEEPLAIFPSDGAGSGWVLNNDTRDQPRARDEGDEETRFLQHLAQATDVRGACSCNQQCESEQKNASFPPRMSVAAARHLRHWNVAVPVTGTHSLANLHPHADQTARPGDTYNFKTFAQLLPSVIIISSRPVPALQRDRSLPLPTAHANHYTHPEL